MYSTTDSITETAHHLAGIAVAAVARDGKLIRISVDRTAPTDPAFDLDGMAGSVRHKTDHRHHQFTAFAGGWAEAKLSTETDPDTDFGGALEIALIDTYDDVYDQDSAAEGEWCAELEDLWLAIRTVAAQVLAGETVTHDAVEAAIAG